jgi:uncharacterized protein with HEPN domain
MKNIKTALQDMLNAIESVESYAVKSFEIFSEDGKSQDAIMYNLIVLGEAANRIPVDFQDNHPEIPWTSIIGTRNVIIHGYDQVKLLIVWDIIQKNLKPLKDELIKLV